jgi:quercetin dioxygenase-like cupin family protein
VASGEAYWGPGNKCTFLVTGEQSGGSLFVFDCIVAPGGGPLAHRHVGEDEMFFVYDGAVEFSSDGETKTVVAGESVFIPRGITHTYRNVRDTDASMLTMFTPAGMEGWFREAFITVDDAARQPPPMTDALIARMLATGSRYNVEWIGDA